MFAATIQQTSVPSQDAIGKPENNNILIVEDDKFLRNLITEKLRKEGYSVTGAVDGDEGARFMKEKRPSLVLLDLLIPGINGFDLLEMAQKDTLMSSIPVLVLSNLGSKEDMDRASSLGAKGFLVKANHTPAEIVDAVKKTIQETYL